MLAPICALRSQCTEAVPLLLIGSCLKLQPNSWVPRPGLRVGLHPRFAFLRLHTGFTTEGAAGLDAELQDCVLMRGSECERGFFFCTLLRTTGKQWASMEPTLRGPARLDILMRIGLKSPGIDETLKVTLPPGEGMKHFKAIKNRCPAKGLLGFQEQAQQDGDGDRAAEELESPHASCSRQ